MDSYHTFRDNDFFDAVPSGYGSFCMHVLGKPRKDKQRRDPDGYVMKGGKYVPIDKIIDFLERKVEKYEK